jgi:parallel beta-helix repeat protein
MCVNVFVNGDDCGYDKNSGLSGIVDYLKKLRGDGKKGLIEVVIDDGDYSIPGGLQLSSDLQSDVENPLVFRARNRGEVSLHAGIFLTGFTELKDGVYRLDLVKAGHPDLNVEELIFNGKRMTVARYPSLDNDNPIGGGWLYREGRNQSIYMDGFGEKDRFFCHEPRLKTWKQVAGTEIHIYPRYGWFDCIEKIKSYDPETGEVVLENKLNYEIYPQDRFYFRNVPDELNQPGEWYFDKDAKILYFIPPTPLESGTVVVPTAKSIVSLTGIKAPEKGKNSHPADHKWGYISFEGIVFDGSVENCISVKDATTVNISGCTIRNSKRCGIRIEGGYNCSVTGCDVYATGSTGISLSGGFFNSFFRRVISGRHSVINNYVHHAGQINKSSSGVEIHGVGLVVRNNLIHDIPRAGLVFKGPKHLIEYNYIRHVMAESSDGAGIYTNHRSHQYYGTRIRYNIVHDVVGYGKNWQTGEYESPHFAFGIYLDDYTSGVEVTGNLVYNTKKTALFIHDGSNCVAENNILACDCNEALGFRKQPFWREYSFCGTENRGMKNNRILRNIIYSNTPGTPAVELLCHNNHMESNGWPGDMAKVQIPEELSDEMPKTISYNGHELCKFMVDSDTVDFCELFGHWHSECTHDQTQGAYAFREISSDRDQEVRLLTALRKGGLIRLNGEEIWSDQGQGADEVLAAANQVVALKLKKGRNLLTVKSIAGFVTWDLSVGPLGDGVNWVGPWTVFGMLVEPCPRRAEQTDVKAKVANNRFSKNMYWNGTNQASISYWEPHFSETEKIPFAQWQDYGYDQDSIVAEPGFVDAKNFDFRLKDDSLAIKSGFLPLPLNKVGPYESTSRASWPIVEAEGIREKPAVPEQSQ